MTHANLSHGNQLCEIVANSDKLPPLPDVAQALLRLRDDPNADAKRLAAIVEIDPSLAAQLVRYAASALFGYRGRIDSIADAISRVLGFEKAMHIALGLSSGKALVHDHSGPLGLKSVWEHALLSASLIQRLGTLIGGSNTPGQVNPMKPVPGLLYLSGLLHNIGFLLLGHFFEGEFRALNEAAFRRGDEPVINLEKELLGTTHCELGATLLRRWRMPGEVLTAVLNHHNEAYRGEAAVYANITLLADRLLKRIGVGDGDSTELPEGILEALGIRHEAAEEELGLLMEKRREFDSTINVLLWNATKRN